MFNVLLVQYGPEIRKKANPIATLHALKQLAKKSFIDLRDDFTLMYIDGEGSSITMVCCLCHYYNYPLPYFSSVMMRM